jgi:hypothetical protein
MAWQVTEVQKALKGANYPMTGDQLADLARGNGADDALVEELRGLREVDGPNGVMKELKGELGGSTPGGNDAAEHQYKDVDGPSFQVTDVSATSRVRATPWTARSSPGSPRATAPRRSSSTPSGRSARSTAPTR